MTIKEVVEQRKKELKSIINQALSPDKDYCKGLCITYLMMGLNNNNKRFEEELKYYDNSILYYSKDFKKICIKVYEMGTSFGPLEKEYVKEQLINKWLNKEIGKRKKFLGLF